MRASFIRGFCILIGSALFMGISYADDGASSWYTHYQKNMIDQINQDNMKRSIDNAVELQKSIGDFNTEIGQARQQFWALYPDKPGFAEAQKRFSDDLFAKDMMFLAEPKAVRVLAGMGDQDNDGGIPSQAIVEFNFWVKSIKDKSLGQQSIDDSTLEQLAEMWGKVPQAMIDSQRYYQAYVVQRDWAEFDRAGVTPGGNDPVLYGTLLCTRYEKETPDEAAVEYKAMEDALGSDNVRAAMAKVRAAPKNKFGNIANMQALGLLQVCQTEIVGPSGPTNQLDNSVLAPAGKIPIYDNDPLSCAVALATQSDPRLYVLSLFATKSPALHTKNAHNGTEYGALTNYTYDWPYAQATYDKWTVKYGADAMQTAARKLLAAPRKLGDGGVADLSNPRDVGEDSYPAFHELLRSDPKAYVRAVLCLSAPDDPPAALDAAYQKLVSTYGENAVLAAAVTMYNAENNRDLPTEGTLLDTLTGILKGTVNIEKPPAPVETPAPVNPEYSAWKKCQAGTKVTFFSSMWSQVNARFELSYPNFRETYTLRSVDDKEARFWDTVVSIFQDSTNPPDDREYLVDAKQDEDGAVAARSGFEMLSIDGKDIPCHWVTKTGAKHNDPGSETTVWTSDQVPGGKVRSLTVSPDRSDPQGKSYREEILLSFDPTTAGASTTPPASGADEKITPSGLLDVMSPLLHRKSLAPNALASVENVAPPSTPEAPPSASAEASGIPNREVIQKHSALAAVPDNGLNTPLKQLTGKTTGSADLDARIMRDYDAPDNGKLPEQTRLAIRREIWTLIHSRSKLNSYLVRQLAKMCDALENGMPHQ